MVLVEEAALASIWACVRKPAPKALPRPATPEAAVKNIFSDNTILYFLMEYSVFMYMKISWG